MTDPNVQTVFQWLKELATNPFLVTSISSWGIAQVLKVIINFVVQKKIVWERLFGDGGMPSGHSATVSSLALITALRCGPGSVQFALQRSLRWWCAMMLPVSDWKRASRRCC